MRKINKRQFVIAKCHESADSLLHLFHNNIRLKLSLVGYCTLRVTSCPAFFPMYSERSWSNLLYGGK